MRRQLLIIASGFFVTCTTLGAGPAAAEGLPERLELGELPSDESLVQMLWQRSPELVAARAKVESARGDLERTELLPNPELDLSLNNFPIGTTNPPGLSPLGEVANYSAGLSELVEVGKREPRQASARSALHAAAYDAWELLRQRVLDFRERIAEVAAAEVTVAALAGLQEDATRLTTLTQQRVSKGDAAGLDWDRAVLEEAKLSSNLAEARQHLSTALLACAQAVSLPCEPFGSAEKAEAFLERVPGPLASPSTAQAALDARPDLQSLAAQEASAQAARTLAQAKALPDVTFHVGYIQDQFVVSGNQPRAIFAGLSVPLPLFDHGQADARQASAAAEAARLQRTLLRTQAEHDSVRLLAQQTEAVARRQHLHGQTLPLARDIVERLAGAVRSGGAPLQDLLLARRTLGELLVDAAELDLLAYHLTATLARTTGQGLTAPAGLRELLPPSPAASPAASPAVSPAASQVSP